MHTTENFDCSLSHPIYDLLSNKTRLEILRLIACEKNYGSRLASILKISAPAIHRHIKILSGKVESEDIGEFAFLKPSEYTRESYSGHKGAEATMYEVGSKLFLTFAIYPNFVHSHAFLTPVQDENIDKDSITRQQKKKREADSPDEIAEIKRNFSQIYNKIQEKNDKINKLEQEILQIFLEKDILMKELDEAILDRNLLDYDERVSIRTLACQGPDCIANLPELLKQDEELVKKMLKNLNSKKWFDYFDKKIKI